MEKCSFCTEYEFTHGTVPMGEYCGCLFTQEQNERDWEADADHSLYEALF